MKKIIFVASTKDSFPFLDELTIELVQRNFEIEVFDMFSMQTVKSSPSHNSIISHPFGNILSNYTRKKFLGGLLRLLYYKIFLLLRPLNCDHLSIQFALPIYRYFFNHFKKRSKSVSVCIWGSDFYRVSQSKLFQMEKYFLQSDKIILCNSKMASDFTSFFERIPIEKIVQSGFGIAKLDSIDYIKKTKSDIHLKKELNFPDDKIIISVGYNGFEAQQHLKIISELRKLSPSVIDKIFVVVQFGYGGDLAYKERIKMELNSVNVSFQILDEFLSNEDVSKIRICSDVVLNAQISDAASASIQEHLFAGAVLLAGSWLPYSYFSQNGIKIWTFDWNDFSDKLERIILNFPEYSISTQDNKRNVANLSRWSNRIDEWINNFNLLS